jgi:hypothetical protein
MPLVLEVTQVENPNAKPVRLKVEDSVRTGEQLKQVIAAADRKRSSGVPGFILRLWDAKAGAYTQLRDDERLVPSADGVLRIGLQRARPLASCNAPTQSQPHPQQQQQQQQQQQMQASPHGAVGAGPSAAPGTHPGAYSAMPGAMPGAAAGAKRIAPDATPAEMHAGAAGAKRARAGPTATPAPPPSQQVTGPPMPRHASAAAELKRGSPAPPAFSSSPAAAGLTSHAASAGASRAAVPSGAPPPAVKKEEPTAPSAASSAARGLAPATAPSEIHAARDAAAQSRGVPPRMSAGARADFWQTQRQSDILDAPLITMGALAPQQERSTLAAAVNELLRVSSML